MASRLRPLAAGLVSLVACGELGEPSGAGGIALNIVSDASAVTLDSGRVIVQGPTDTMVRATPGSKVTITQLSPGSYSVALQGFVGTQVDHFGQTTGVPVVAGQNAEVTVSFQPFRPVLNQPPMYTTDLHFLVSFPPVPGAASYTIEVATSADFSSAEDTSITGTSINIPVDPIGTIFVRARATDPFGGLGPVSEPRSIETFRMINFDATPAGSPVAAGTVVNDLYAEFGITFTKLGPGTSCGTGPEVYANDNQPVTPFSGNTVSTCPQGIASDISENGFGVVEAIFAQAASQVCIDVAPDGPGDAAFLEALDANNGSLQRITSNLGVQETFCIHQAGARKVHFSGDGTRFARFDNLKVVF
jgi:hypothetical protein